MDDPKLPKKSTFCRLGTLYWAENDNIFSFFVLFSFLSALYWAADDPKTRKKMFFLSFFVLIWLGEMKNIQKHTVKTTCTKKWTIRILSARVAWENFEKNHKNHKF